ncbi:MAG: hypothetical protein A2Y88_04015 [Chloroflexi bacterium RBG_13_48_10]|nr:MAG: hypothetical protein A2Y88_04015 [Chloroflexi bacterium RBG_13_48_10]
MMMFGWLIMLVVIGLPIFLVVLLVIAATGFLPNLAHSESPFQNQSPAYQPAMNSRLAGATATRYCSHCGTGLQSEWTHCPQCGAPIQ